MILDWSGQYPDPEAFLTPLLSCTNSDGDICFDGEAAISGSFWTTPGLQNVLRETDQRRGASRLEPLRQVEQMAAEGAAYIPVWLEAPRAWGQTDLSQPTFDGSGRVELSRLKRQN